MLYRSLGTSARADRPLDTNPQSPSGDQASPGKRPETHTMEMGVVASRKVFSIVVVVGSGVSHLSVVRRGASWRIGVHRTQVRAFLVCMERYNLAVVSGVFNARDAMQKKVTRGRTRIAKQKSRPFTQ